MSDGKLLPDYQVLTSEPTEAMLRAALDARYQRSKRSQKVKAMFPDGYETWLRVGMKEDAPGIAEEFKAMLAAAPSAWISVEERLPENGKLVIAHHLNRIGKHRVIRAFYARRFTIEDNSDRDIGDGCEDHEGTTYINEGWYEENEHDEFYWFVSQPVTHWQPLPLHP